MEPTRQMKTCKNSGRNGTKLPGFDNINNVNCYANFVMKLLLILQKFVQFMKVAAGNHC